MNVRELIAKLGALDPEMPVLYWQDGYGYGTLDAEVVQLSRETARSMDRSSKGFV